jgi:hypothetical protein
MTENKIPRSVLVFGWLSAAFLAIGTFFKFMHWPGASPMVMAGSVFFMLFYLPLWLIGELKNGRKLATIAQALILLLSSLSYLWKAMHWPAGSVIFNIWIGIMLYIVFPVSLFILFSSQKKSFRGFHIIIVLFLLVCMIIGSISRSASSMVNLATTFSKNTEYITHSIDKLKIKNKQLYKAFGENTPLPVNAQWLKLLSDSTQSYLQHFRDHVIAINENINEAEADTIAMSDMLNLLNTDIIAREVCGSNDYELRKGKYSGLELKGIIDNFRDSVIALAGEENRAFIQSGINLDTEPVTNSEGESDSWVSTTFRYITAPMFLHIIENLKYEIKNAETQVLSDILNSSRQNSGGLASKVAELGTQLENERKQREIENLKNEREMAQVSLENKNKDIAAQARVIIGFVVVTLICSVMIFFIIRSNVMRRQMNKELARQKHLIEEKNKEITDSIRYARRIQTAHLPTSGYISKMFQKLKE